VHTYTLSAFTKILASRLNQTLGTLRHCLLSRRTCSPLCKHHGAMQYSASSTTMLDLDVWPRPEPG
jgi:hypothetical protein